MSSKRTFPGHLAFVEGRDAVEPGGPTARVRKHCPGITVWPHTFSGRSGPPLLIGPPRPTGRRGRYLPGFGMRYPTPRRLKIQAGSSARSPSLSRALLRV